jgi:hypothetical protein
VTRATFDHCWVADAKVGPSGAPICRPGTENSRRRQDLNDAEASPKATGGGFGHSQPHYRASSSTILVLKHRIALFRASEKDWLEASAGLKLPVGQRAGINSSVTLAAFSTNAPTVQDDIGVGMRF